jgi:ribosomal protein S18 acetylase RimI-like enzyme
MEIRAAAMESIPEIATIFRITRQHDLPYLPKLHSAEEDLEYFKNKVFVENKIIIACKNRNIVGFCAFNQEWLNHLYVLPEYQGNNIGKILLEKAMEESQKLQLWTFQKNNAAIKFYEKNGFELVRITDGQDNEEKEPDALYCWPKETQI